MIKKDVVLKFESDLICDVETKESNKSNNEIDAIFESADTKMSEQNKPFVTKTKKRKPMRLLRIIITFFVVLILIIFATYKIFSYYMETAFPEIKESFLSSVEIQLEGLKEIDDSTLTVEQYYQKELLLLITVEDLENVINEFSDITKFKNILEDNKGELDSFDLIPEDKVDRYNEIIEEYERASEEGRLDDMVGNAAN